jgi:hypothetical protein
MSDKVIVDYGDFNNKDDKKKAAQLQEKLREGLMKHLAMKIEEDKKDAEHNKNNV